MMRVVVAVWGVVSILFLVNIGLYAQISQGGKPISITLDKGNEQRLGWFKIPSVKKINSLKQPEVDNNGNYLKPLRFACLFDVALNPQNSGKWTFQNKYKIWRLGIESTEAYSLGLIFSRFKIPPGACLFIYNEDRSGLIGAFTEKNNNSSGIFPVMPVAGDKIIIQYEELSDSEFEGELEISKVSHDFTGVTLKSNDPRRPYYGEMAGYCNVDINCPEGEDYKDIKNSVCRLYIAKSGRHEICSGVLLNNTSNNGKPYVLTAAHCIENNLQAQSSLFLFNYESPYCGSIDGDNTNSISGGTLVARFDSLDFALVELSVEPPNYFRPYYAGWDVSGAATSSSFSIHQPKGDIKKIAIDEDSPVTASYSSDYIGSSFWKIQKWEKGVTEIGSSGGPLFNNQSRIIGSLSGGAATCANPVSDYFEKLSRSWNYNKTASKQLKHWLDPINSGEAKIDGYDPYSGELKCGVFTNFTMTDTTMLKKITGNETGQGYWTGTNAYNYYEFAEKFSGLKSCDLYGVSLGVAKKYIDNQATDVSITIKVYDGDEVPGNVLHSEDYVLNTIARDAMNYFAFEDIVSTTGNFFISYSINLLNPADTFAVYQAERDVADNTFFLRNNGAWKNYRTLQGTTSGSALLMELVACNIDDSNSVEPWPVIDENNFAVFPNPVSSGDRLHIGYDGKSKKPEKIRLYDLLGKEIPFQIISESETGLQLQLRDARVGIYLLQIEADHKNYLKKIIVTP